MANELTAPTKTPATKSNLTIEFPGHWKDYWGAQPLPAGSAVLGTVRLDPCRTGALIQLRSGAFVQGNAGCLRSLPKSEVRQAISS